MTVASPDWLILRFFFTKGCDLGLASPRTYSVQCRVLPRIQYLCCIIYIIHIIWMGRLYERPGLAQT